MPRKAPPETLYPKAYRFTRKQIRKINEMGGSEWLRELVSNFQPKKVRDTIAALQAQAARNRDIVEGHGTTAFYAEKYQLSVKRVQQIRREWRQLSQSE